MVVGEWVNWWWWSGCWCIVAWIHEVGILVGKSVINSDPSPLIKAFFHFIFHSNLYYHCFINSVTYINFDQILLQYSS